MSELIKEYGTVGVEAQQRLFALVRAAASTIPMQTSQLYSPAKATKYVDPEQRSSHYKLLTSIDVFDAAEGIVSAINALDPNTDYVLFRNDVTHIVYGPKDFFNTHEDYLSLTSNTVVEYTMLVCMDVEADTQGGETVFHVNEWFQHVSRSSITPGHVLVFRKDLRHEGRELVKGRKEILTLNLLGVPKHSDTIIAVYPRPDAASVTTAVRAKRKEMGQTADVLNNGPKKARTDIEAVESLDTEDSDSLVAANDSNEAGAMTPRSSVFYLNLTSVRNTSNSLLEAFANSMLVKERAGLAPKRHVWVFQDDHFSVSEFEIIYKIYQKSYLKMDEFKAHRKLIDYFQLHLRDILIDVSSVEASGQNSEALAGGFTVPRSHMSMASQTRLSLEEPVVLCIDEAHARGLSDFIKSEHAPLVRFQMLLAEGSLSFGGGMSGTEPSLLNMSPMWVVFGDERQLLLKSVFLTKSDVQDDFEELVKQQNTWDPQDDDDEDDHDEDEDPDRTDARTCYFGLKVVERGASLVDVMSEIVDAETGSVAGGWKHLPSYKPEEHDITDCGAYTLISPKQSPSADPTISKQVILAHQQQAVVDKIRQIDLFKYVREAIQSQFLLLPQLKQSQEHHFCNESVYGNATFLLVNGFLRID